MDMVKLFQQTRLRQRQLENPLPIRVTVMYEVKDNACLSQTNQKARTPVICTKWQIKNKDCFMPFSAYEPFANLIPLFHL